MRDPNIDLAKSPCDDPDLPVIEEEEIVFLTRDEFMILLGGFPEEYQRFVQAQFVTGMRFGKITALPVKH